MKNEDLDDLIDACLDGRLSEADAAKISELIENSADARARYWELASVHGLLEQALQQVSLQAAIGQPGPASAGFSRLFQWRALTAAAAGLVFGMFSASMVWAYAVPLVKGPAHETVDLFLESFEEEVVQPGRGFPTHSGEWSGDMTLAPRVPGVEPFEGDRMIKLTPVTTRKFAYARRIIDLGEQPAAVPGQTRQLEVVAAFAARDSTIPARYQIRLAAFSQSPSEVRPIWNDEAVLFDTVLQQTGRNVVTEPGELGWRKIRATLEVPPGARSLVISLAAAQADASQPAEEHYLDAVRARLILTRTVED